MVNSAGGECKRIQAVYGLTLEEIAALTLAALEGSSLMSLVPASFRRQDNPTKVFVCFAGIAVTLSSICCQSLILACRAAHI